MDDILNKIYSEDSADFFVAMYEYSQNNGRILTNEFKEKSKIYAKPKRENREFLDKEIKFICKDNEQLNNELQNTVEKYIKTIECENSFLIKEYYKQGVKDGIKLLIDLYYDKK